MPASDTGFVYIWRYVVRSGDEAEFERLYGPGGSWAQFFARSPAYMGTDLLHSRDPDCYVTVDRWRSAAAHAEFLADNKAQFDALDEAGERLTLEEKLIGGFDVVEEG